ncbi:unnamed protein product [Rhodiola kirilowii]
MLRYICDICGTAASTVFCHTDSTYLCSGCDDFIHAEANPMAGHHFRVPIHTTTDPSSSLLCGEFAALNHCQAETSAAAAASDHFFYYGSDTPECFDDLMTLTSSCSDDVLQTSCCSHQGIQQDCDNMNVPIMHSLELDQSLNATPPWMKHPEVSTIQSSSVCAPPNFQTVPKSVSYIRPEITLSFTTKSSQHPKAKTVECLAHTAAEKPISREERVQRFREKRQAKKTRTNIKFPSKKAYAASIRPRFNGKFARKIMTKKSNQIK